MSCHRGDTGALRRSAGNIEARLLREYFSGCCASTAGDSCDERLVEPFSPQEFLYPALDFIAYCSNIFNR